jgi:hypothetical protein
MSEEQGKTRKELLRAAGVVAGAAVVGQLAAADAAEAGDGNSLVLGSSANTATNKTVLTTSGATIADAAAFGVTSLDASWGISGEGAAYGVVGKGPGGVLGLGTVGGVFSGSVAAVNLDPADTLGAPAGQAFKGDLAVDSAGVLWMCVAAGTPGTWIKVSHGGVRPLASPQRAFGAVLKQGEEKAMPIAGVVPGVPDRAVGILGNLTVFDFLGGGYVSLFPSGSARPSTSSINWNGPAPVPGAAIANAFSVGLGADGGVALFADATVAAGSTATNVLLDVTAYIL